MVEVTERESTTKRERERDGGWGDGGSHTERVGGH